MRWLRRKERENDPERELRSDLDLEKEEQQGNGVSVEDARWAAIRALGNTTRLKEEVREMWGWTFLDRLKQDIIYATRVLRKNPGFTATAVLSLALGIGANTAIFSIVNAVLLQPLPYRQSDRLVMLWEQDRKGGQNFVSPANFRDWREQNRSFDRVAAFLHTTFTITGGDRPERVAGELVSWDLMPLLGVAPALGRGFVLEDERQIPYTSVILSDGLWRRRFGGDPAVIGKTLESNGRKLTIVGVVPGGFDFPSGLIRTPPEIWVPLARPAQEWTVRGFHYLRVVGRLRDGITLPAAASEMAAIQTSIAAKDKDAFPAIRVVNLANEVVGDVKTPLLVIFAAVSFVLLIACVNVANLILARSSARQREFAVRLALGAGRARVIRQLSTESLLLGILGGAVGISVGVVMTKALVAVAPANVPRLAGVQMDSHVLLFALSISMLTGLLSGLVPAFTFSVRRLGEQLKAGGRGAGQAAGGRLRSVLVVSEIAIAIVLVAGAGLMVQSLYHLEQVRPGFRTDNILSFFVTIPQVRYPAARQAAFFAELMGRIRTIPGVESVGATTALPLSGTEEDYSFEIEGRSRREGQPMMGAHYRVVTPEYFLTLGIPVLRGRVFGERDSADSVPAVVINEALARRYFPSDDPLVKHIFIGNGRHPVAAGSEVIGIVKDVSHSSLAARPMPEMYECYSQAPQPGMTLTVRSASDPRTVLPAIRRELGLLDRDVPLSKVLTMADLMGESLAPSRFRGALLGAFALFAMILAALGVYGVMAYTLSRRTSEIGIRVALGARPGQVLELMIGRALRLSLIGVAIGVIAALWLTRFLKELLFEVGPADARTFAMAALILTVAAMAAAYIPARRAMKVDPMAALRHE
jgi:putative ABC transport system permease protein